MFPILFTYAFCYDLDLWAKALRVFLSPLFCQKYALNLDQAYQKLHTALPWHYNCCPFSENAMKCLNFLCVRPATLTHCKFEVCNRRPTTNPDPSKQAPNATWNFDRVIKSPMGGKSLLVDLLLFYSEKIRLKVTLYYKYHVNLQKIHPDKNLLL